MKSKIVKLKNNGTLIYSKSKLNNSTAVEVGFKAGAYNDEKYGTAHFLEHTLFKKTKNRDNLTIENDRNTIVFLNAMTSTDYLILSFFRSNKLICESMEFAEDVLMNSVIDDEFIETEKGVITEELNMCIDNESRDIYEKNIKQCQSKAMFSSDIVGKTEENIRSITFDDLVKFKKKYFTGENFICSVTSSLSFSKIKKLVNKYFVNFIPSCPKNPEPKSNFKDCSIDKTPSLEIFNNSQDKITVMISFCLIRTEEDFRNNQNYIFLSKHFSGEQGDLFLSLRNKGLIYRLNSDFSCFNQDSLFNIIFESSKEKIKEITYIIEHYVQKLLNEKVDERFIEAYKKNFEYYNDEKMPIKMRQSCHNYLIDYLYFGKIIEINKKMKEKIKNSLSSEGVQKVAQEIFNKKNKLFVTVLGNTSKEFVPDFDSFKKGFLIWEN